MLDEVDRQRVIWNPLIGDSNGYMLGERTCIGRASWDTGPARYVSSWRCVSVQSRGTLAMRVRASLTSVGGDNSQGLGYLF